MCLMVHQIARKKLVKPFFYFRETMIIPLSLHSHSELPNEFHWAYKLLLLLTTLEKCLGGIKCFNI